MKKLDLILIAVIVASFVLAAYFYPLMPEQVASHWNSAGKVDSFMPKLWGAFLMPVMLAGLFVLFKVIPKIDPLKANIELFRKYYEVLVTLLISFLFYVYLLTLAWTMGQKFNMTSAIMPAIGILFYGIGVVLETTKRNWFIGIRTPWTLSSDAVWEKTHKLGSKLFKAIAIIAFLSLFFPGQLLLLVVGPALLVALYLVVYSYIEYKKETKSK